MISIIVPTYNVESYIKRTIESVLNQTYTNIEVICVNDGSTDDTLQRLRTIAELDDRVKIFTKKNEGVTLARKFGVEHANGEYIGFVDADDIIDSTMYERLYKNLSDYQADISHCAHDIVWLNGKRERFYGTARLAQQDKISGLKSLISGSFEPGLCNKLYKHTLLHNLLHSDVMDYSIKINEDLLMNYYLFKSANTTVFEDVCLYHYIKREGSASSSPISSKFIWDQINVKQIILKDAKDTEYESDAIKAMLITCIIQYNILLKTKNYEFDTDLRQIASLLRDNKQYFGLLNQKQRIGANAIISCPKLYGKVAARFS